VFRSLVACALAVCVLNGCAATPAGEPEATAVSQAQVIAHLMSTAPVTFIAASSGPFTKYVGAANAGPDPTRPVWAIDFEGSFSLSCGPQSDAPKSCPVNATLRVFLDEVTGVEVLSESPAPKS
jgi:hypothetical protein